MGRGVAEATLRVWAPQGAEVLFVRQVAPTLEDLTVAAPGVQPAHGRLPDGLVGRRVPRLPRGRAGRRRSRSAPSSWPPACSCVVGGDVVSSGPGQGHVVRRRRPDHAHRPGGRPLHRPGRAGRGHPGGPRRPGRRRRRHGHRQARPGRAAGRRNRATTRRRSGCARSSTSRTRARARCVCERDVDKLDEMALDTASTKTSRVGKAAQQQEGTRS